MILLAILATAAASHPAALVGRYNGGQMEIGAGLILRADGRFRYGLAYGALDEEAEGIWEARDGAVLLTTRPAVTPPAFIVEKDEPVISGEIFATLGNPKSFNGFPLRMILFYGPDDQPMEAEVAADGHVVLPDSRRPEALIPEVPVYGLVTEPYPLAGKSGHRITFRFEPHDLGKADFRATPLMIEGGTLVLPRFDRVLRFHREK